MTDAPISRIVLHVDATESALDAARYAVALAKAYSAELHAIYVVNVRSLEELLKAKVFVAEEQAELEHDLEEDGKRYLRAVEKLAVDKDVWISSYMVKGVVHREVIDKANEIGARLIIIPELEEALSRRNSFFDEGEIIVRLARCPVLIVRNSDLVRNLYENI